jgi:hypothetical protein
MRGLGTGDFIVSWRVAVAAMILMAAGACATPTRLYTPAVAEKPRGEAEYQADVAACKSYEAQTRLAIGMFGIAGAVASGNGAFDTPNDIVDSCMMQRGYQVLSNGGRY